MKISAGDTVTRDNTITNWHIDVIAVDGDWAWIRHSADNPKDPPKVCPTAGIQRRIDKKDWYVRPKSPS